jgi:hypothetical protein
MSATAARDIDHLEYDELGGNISGIQILAETERSITARFIFPGRPAGTYSGTVDFYACKDEGCSALVPGSPFKLPYTVTVQGPPPPQVTPNPISVSVEANDAKTIDLSVTVASTRSLGVGVNDAAGRFSTQVEQLSMIGNLRTVRISTVAIPTPGSYTGSLSVFLCETSPCTPAAQLPGTQASVPYTLSVTAAVLLQPVPTASGLPEWETFQGTESHSGFVPVTLDPARFSSRWSWTPPFGSSALSPVTAGSGKVVVTASGYFGPASVFAVNESDGSLAWRHDFGSIFAANHPAVWGGRVFVATSGHEDTAMWSLDLANGGVLFRTNFASQWEHYLAPTVAGGYVYTNGGYYGGMYSFKANTGSQRWFAGLNQYDLWTPAVDGNYAYAYTGYEFTVVNRLTGSPFGTVTNPDFNWLGYALNIAPVLPGDGSALVVDGVYSAAHPNHLIRYVVTGSGEGWRADGSFVSNPVVANGLVYVLNAAANRLEVRDLATGTMQWTWVVPSAQESLPVGNLVLTNNLIFLTTNAATYAIDLATHAPVWSIARTGDLALSSNRVLYIASDTRIDAIDLATP